MPDAMTIRCQYCGRDVSPGTDHYCPTAPPVGDAADEIERLRAQVAELQANNATLGNTLWEVMQGEADARAEVERLRNDALEPPGGP